MIKNTLEKIGKLVWNLQHGLYLSIQPPQDVREFITNDPERKAQAWSVYQMTGLLMLIPWLFVAILLIVVINQYLTNISQWHVIVDLTSTLQSAAFKAAFK